MSNPRERDTSVDHAALRALKGRECIFKEKALIRFVVVTDVTIDDWGPRVTLEILHAPGFKNSGHTPFWVGCIWEVLAVSDRCVSGYGGWLLVVRPDLVDRIKAIAPETPNPFHLMQRVNEVTFRSEG